VRNKVVEHGQERSSQTRQQSRGLNDA
jgi:hypothetical protein